ncbi:Serine/threonine kinase [Fasciola hepatica]|uniref:non-specific serine/threonine protein kinase n=1 Tax=Fasciola hepatica TaxID=6192 RepID=A0A4E0RVQ6_FASHE|nr:Serine/threonine kinase [Fasciola hepatica]
MCSADNFPLNELERKLLDPESECYLENLLDVITSLVADCNYPSATNSRAVQSFLKRYAPVAQLIETRRTKYTDFELIKVIGQGGFGRVELARHKRTRRVYAIKMMSKQHLLDHSQSGYWEERDVMVQASSEWLVACHHAFLDKDNVYLCMEYMPGGDLYYWLEKYDTFNETQVRFYLSETVLALEALHNLKFIHRDLKPDNMLLDARGHLKLADFGSCVQVADDGYHFCNSPIGTPDYISPEMLNCQSKPGKIGPECDWWALGVIAFEMLFGEPAFYGQSLVETYSRILSHEKSLVIPTDADPISPDLESLIRALLKPAATRLGSLAQVRTDPTITDILSAIAASTAQVKSHPFFQPVIWHQVRSQEAPIKPVVNSETDTSNINFDERELSLNSAGGIKLPQVSGAFAPKKPSAPAYFTGNNLSFAGYTFNRDHTYLKSTSTLPNSEQTNSHDSGSKVQTLETELSELKTQLQALEKQNAMNEVALKDAQRRIVESNSELELARVTKVDMEKNVTDLRNRLSAAQEGRDQMNNNLTQLKNQLQQTADNFETERRKIRVYEEEKTALSGQIDQLQGQIQTLRIQLDEQRKLSEATQQSATTEKTSAEHERIRSLEAEVSSLQAENREARQKATVLASEASNLRRNYQEQVLELNDQLAAAQNFCRLYETQIRENQDSLTAAKQIELDLMEELKTTKKNLEVAVQARRLLEDTVVARESELAGSKVEVRSLEEQFDNFRKQMNAELSRLQALADQRLSEMNEVSSQLDDMRNRCSVEEENNGRLTEQVCKLQKEKEVQQRNMDVIVNKLYQEMEHRIIPPEGRNRARKKQDSEAYQQLERKFKKLESTSQRSIADLRRTIDQYKRDLAERTNTITNLTEECRAKDAELAQLNNLISLLYARLDQTTPSQSTPVKRNFSLESRTNAADDFSDTLVRVPSRTPSIGSSTGNLSPPAPQELTVSTDFGEPGRLDVFSIVLEQVVDLDGKGRGRNKQTWLPKYAVLKPFVLAFYVSRADKELGAGPVDEIPLCRVVHFRKATSLDLIHSKAEDVARTLQLFYKVEEVTPIPANGDTPGIDLNTTVASIRTNASSHNGSGDTHIRWLDHTFQHMRFRMGQTLCDVCHRPCSDLLNPPPALECIKCRTRIHLEHVDKHQKFASCHNATQVRYLRMPSTAELETWLQHLNELGKRLRELQSNPEKLLESGLAGLAAAAGGVAHIGTISAATPLYRSMRAGSTGAFTGGVLPLRPDSKPGTARSSFKQKHSRHGLSPSAKSPTRSVSPDLSATSSK